MFRDDLNLAANGKLAKVKETCSSGFKATNWWIKGGDGWVEDEDTLVLFAYAGRGMKKRSRIRERCINQ